MTRIRRIGQQFALRADRRIEQRLDALELGVGEIADLARQPASISAKASRPDEDRRADRGHPRAPSACRSARPCAAAPCRRPWPTASAEWMRVDDAILEGLGEPLGSRGIAGGERAADLARNRSCASSGTRSRQIQAQIGSRTARAMRPCCLCAGFVVDQERARPAGRTARDGSSMRGTRARRTRARRCAPPAAGDRRPESPRRATAARSSSAISKARAPAAVAGDIPAIARRAARRGPSRTPRVQTTASTLDSWRGLKNPLSMISMGWMRASHHRRQP